MNHWRGRTFAVAAIVLALLASAVYLKWDSKPVSAMHGCDMKTDSGAGSSMESCPMGQGKGSAAAFQELVLDGSILGVNKATRTVSVKADLPVSAEAVKDLSTVKPGVPVAVSVRLDAKGKPVVSRIAPAGGTATFKLTGIQCQMCADRVQAALKGTAGVNQVTVTANPPRAQISFDPAKTSAGALKAVIRNTSPIHQGTPFDVQD